MSDILAWPTAFYAGTPCLGLNETRSVNFEILLCQKCSLPQIMPWVAFGCSLPVTRRNSSSRKTVELSWECWHTCWDLLWHPGQLCRIWCQPRQHPLSLYYGDLLYLGKALKLSRYPLTGQHRCFSSQTVLLVVYLYSLWPGWERALGGLLVWHGYLSCNRMLNKRWCLPRLGVSRRRQVWCRQTIPYSWPGSLHRRLLHMCWLK